jgi:hypothetical protein
MHKSNTNLFFILKVFSLLVILMVGLLNRDSPNDQLKSENLIRVDANLNNKQALVPIKQAGLIIEHN